MGNEWKRGESEIQVVCFFQKELSFYVYPADAKSDVWLVQNLLFC